MRLLGIDYGHKRIGIALSDVLEVMASPLEILQRQSLAKDLDYLAALARKHEVGKIVVGLPVNMDGSEGELAAQARAFADALTTRLGIPVELYDERMTTLQADRMLTEEADLSRGRRKEVRDKIAASLILQSYLDSRQAFPG